MVLRRKSYWLLCLSLALSVILAFKTACDVETPLLFLNDITAGSERFQVLDRFGHPLGISYQTRLNTIEIVPLHEIPQVLREAFVTSEDRRFFEHHGVDWKARINAMWQNISLGRTVRGASTITEQVVRILHPRPRNLWSRWIEGFEAMILERHATKGELLEFYLNQVPYAANRRGVAQAARYYFNRDLMTLTNKEMLALAVLPRAPSALDLYRDPHKIQPAILRLSQGMKEQREITEEEDQQIRNEPIALEQPSRILNATHFINYIRETIPYQLSESGVLRTTLDGDLQLKAQNLLDERIKALRVKQVHNGAMLVVDHRTGEILAWVVGGTGDDAMKAETPGHEIDAVRAQRQPGSSMKPFLYALALDSGWSPATEIDDAPLEEAIGSGLHDFHNYSHTFYGKISLREALGNSLNIPALKTIVFVGPSRYLDLLHSLGFLSLTKPAGFYDQGLALGIGEVTLFELVQAYSALANRGIFRPLTPLPQPPMSRDSIPVYSEEAASLIANILSDPFARRREFGSGSVLNLPVQTAIKTGTSTDYRDAWVLGFDSRYTVGVWLGNLDQMPMERVTGSTGPALILRSMFAVLSQQNPSSPLYLSPKLVQKEVCTNYDLHAREVNCFPRTEYFIPGTEPNDEIPTNIHRRFTIMRPTEGLEIAYDPRIPSDRQAFEFIVDGASANHTIQWLLNDKPIATTQESHFLWQIERGHYTLVAQEIGDEGKALTSDLIHFRVK